MILTVTNLYPRPDQPQRGLFNAQLFRAMEAEVRGRRTEDGGRKTEDGGHPPPTTYHPPPTTLLNVCLVPEWRVWRWTAIRRWEQPAPETGVETDYWPVFYVPGAGRDWSGWTYFRSLRPLKANLRDCRGVLAAWLYPDGVAAARLAAELGLPCWIMVQGSDVFHLQVPRRRRAILRAARDVAGFVCVCRPLADALLREGIASAKVQVVPNGVDETRFRFRSKREAWQELAPEGDPPTVRTALFVGNLVPVKGPDVLIEAWHGLIAGIRGPAAGLRLIVIGEGPMRAELERRVRRLDLESSVEFLGRRSHHEVAMWMNMADTLCLTSRSEGMPNVVVEALASGLPVVAADVGACRDLLADEPAARVCVAGDVRGFAAALREMLAASFDRPAMALRHAGRFTWGKQARTILESMGAVRSGDRPASAFSC